MQIMKVARRAHITIFVLLLGIAISSCKPPVIEVFTTKIVVVTRIATQTPTTTPNITLTHSPTVTNKSTTTNTPTVTNTAVSMPSRLTINRFSLAVPDGWSINDAGYKYPILTSPKTTIAFFDGPNCKTFRSLTHCASSQISPQSRLGYVLEDYTGAFGRDAAND